MCFPFCGTGRRLRIPQPMDTSRLMDAINRFESGKIKNRQTIKRTAKTILEYDPSQKGDIIAILENFGYADCVPGALPHHTKKSGDLKDHRKNESGE